MTENAGRGPKMPFRDGHELTEHTLIQPPCLSRLARPDLIAIQHFWGFDTGFVGLDEPPDMVLGLEPIGGTAISSSGLAQTTRPGPSR